MPKKNTKKQHDLIIFRAKSGVVEIRQDVARETIWVTQKQVASIFEVDVRTVNEHLLNIFKSNELHENSAIRKFRITASDGKKYLTKHYNLDAVISVGYRVNSKKATQFRIWATKTLKQHLTQGFTINKKLVGKNYNLFINALADVKALLPGTNNVSSEDVLELVNAFARTWFSLDSYDKGTLPKNGVSKKQVVFTSKELLSAIEELKKDQISKKQATDLFAKESRLGSIEGIVGSVFQSFDKKDVYKTPEEKAAQLLYFMVKNHPFVDGNKRSGAFAFIWFLRKLGILRANLTPETLTALTLLTAESDPKDKDRVVSLIIQLING